MEALDEVDHSKVNRWLKQRGIVLEQSFVSSLEDYVEEIKKDILSNQAIYNILGLSHQIISRWRASQNSTLTKGRLKYQAILNIGKLLGLSDIDTEKFANEAGLSLEFIELDVENINNAKIARSIEISAELFPYNIPKTSYKKPKYITVIDKSNYTGFVKRFNILMSTYDGKIDDLCQSALVSDRMFRYIRSGKHLTKESILAILITINCTLDDIQDCLKKAGFILSNSLPADMVIMWTLKNDLPNIKEVNPVHYINETLDNLRLPLLMTRLKN